MHATENQIAVTVVLEVGIKLWDKLDALISVNDFMGRKRHAKNGDSERSHGIGDGSCDFFIASGHAI